MTWTYPPRRILVPVDFGEASGRALGAAGALARASGAEVHALHAEMLEAPPYFTLDQVSALEAQRAAARAGAERYLVTFAGKNGVPEVVPSVIDGGAADIIAQQAPEFDLIVMGTHGRTGARRWWLGSVAEKVVRNADRPVLVVRADVAGQPADIFRHLLVAAGSSDTADPARQYAENLRGLFGSTVSTETQPCTEERARQLGVTLLVVPISEGDMLRRCALPLLFVPIRDRRSEQW